MSPTRTSKPDPHQRALDDLNAALPAGSLSFLFSPDTWLPGVAGTVPVEAHIWLWERDDPTIVSNAQVALLNSFNLRLPDLVSITLLKAGSARPEPPASNDPIARHFRDEPAVVTASGTVKKDPIVGLNSVVGLTCWIQWPLSESSVDELRGRFRQVFERQRIVRSGRRLTLLTAPELVLFVWNAEQITSTPEPRTSKPFLQSLMRQRWTVWLPGYTPQLGEVLDLGTADVAVKRQQEPSTPPSPNTGEESAPALPPPPGPDLLEQATLPKAPTAPSLAEIIERKSPELAAVRGPRHPSPATPAALVALREALAELRTNGLYPTVEAKEQVRDEIMDTLRAHGAGLRCPGTKHPLTGPVVEAALNVDRHTRRGGFFFSHLRLPGGCGRYGSDHERGTEPDRLPEMIPVPWEPRRAGRRKKGA